MLVTFRCKSTADVIMLSKHAEPLLHLLGKSLNSDLGMRGHIHPDQLPTLITHLESACLEETSQDSPPNSQEDEDDTQHNTHIGLRQRAYPLLDMMKQAFEHNQGISWE